MRDAAEPLMHLYPFGLVFRAESLDSRCSEELLFMLRAEPPRISYIVPCYNARAYLHQCLQSIQVMTRDTYEVIVVDDGSIERVDDIVEAFAPEARYLYQDNQGAAAARNTGIAASTGVYLRFLDADDYLISADSLDKQVRMLDTNERLGLVYSQSLQVDCNGVVTGLRAPGFARESYLRSGEVELFDLLYRNYITMSTVLARRSVIVDAGMFRTDLRTDDGRSRTNEDHECWLHVARIADIGYLHEPTAMYRVHDSNVSRIKSVAQLSKEMEAIDRFFADDEFARRYARVLPAIARRRKLKTSKVAFRNGESGLVRRGAPMAIVESLWSRNWGEASVWVRLFTRSLLPHPRQ